MPPAPAALPSAISLVKRLHAALAVGADARLIERGRLVELDCLVAIDDESHLLRIRSGRPTLAALDRPLQSSMFSVRGSARAWAALWEDRALMAQPKVLMLDEPSLGLAPKIVGEIAAAIRRINDESKLAVLLVEQNARLALRLAHQAHVYEQGQIIRSGSGSELLADPFVQKAYLGL